MKIVFTATLAILLYCGCGHTTNQTNADQTIDAGSCQRRIFESSVANARDLAGWPVAGGIVACGRIFRGGALTTLSEEGCAQFKDLGIRTIVDLREQSVQIATPPPTCATQLAQHQAASMPKLLPDTPENYLALLNETAAIGQIFSLLRKANSYPLYLHCEIGRDRASFVTALVLLALGAERQMVLEEFALSAVAGVVVKPESLTAVLDEIEKRGGIQSFLASAGVDSAALMELRQNLMLEL